MKIGKIILGKSIRLFSKFPFFRKNLRLKGLFDVFFEKPKFYGWGMRTIHENPWNDNYQESIFRESCDYVKNFQFTLESQGLNKDFVDQLKWRHWIVTFATRYAIEFSSETSKNFVECGTADGLTAFFILREIHSNPKISKTCKMFCYDSWDRYSNELSSLESNSIDYSKLDLQTTQQNLIEFKDDLIFCKGYIPDSFSKFPGPESLVFLHIDINSSKTTSEILEYFFPKLSKSAVILFDDYGWKTYQDTKEVTDKFLHNKNGVLLKLPTGQAIFFKNN